MNAQLANGRAAALQATVAHHKAAIRRHRQALSEAAAALAALQRDCRTRGIGLQVIDERAEDTAHGTHRTRSSAG